MGNFFHKLTPAERRRKNLESHELVKTGDSEAVEGSPIVDRNCEVVLGFCRRCRGGEVELEDESCIERLMKRAIAAEAKLPPLRRAMNLMHQRVSWVREESMMNDDGSPNGRTAEEAEALLAKVSPEFVVLMELERRIAADKQPEPEHVNTDGTVRKTRYGAGRQPWDDIVDAGWGPAFAAGNALLLIRTAPTDVRKGQRYYDQLNRLAVAGNVVAAHTMNELDRMLTSEERSTLQDGLTC